MATKTVTICDECGDEMDSDRWYNGVRFHANGTSADRGQQHPDLVTLSSTIDVDSSVVRGQFCIGCNIKLLKMELERLEEKVLDR